MLGCDTPFNSIEHFLLFIIKIKIFLKSQIENFRLAFHQKKVSYVNFPIFM